MKRKTVSAFLLSMCLILSGPGTITAADWQSQSGDVRTQTTEGQSQEETVQTLEMIESCVKNAILQTTPDLSATVMREFLKASNAYDTLSDTDKAKVAAQTQKDIETIRNRIADTIHTAEGVTIGLPDWYAAVQISDTTITDPVLQAAKERYAGSAPVLIYGKDISYTDVRNGQNYRQRRAVSFHFPVPAGYEKLKNPQIVRFSNGKLIALEPKRENGQFYVETVYPLNNIFVLDVPVALTGIKMDAKASINVGQKQKLTVTSVPENTTQDYQLEWSSNAPKVASVDAKGTVTAKKNGTAVITAKVKGTQIAARCTVKVVQGAHALSMPVSEMMANTRTYMRSIDKNPTLGSEWFVFGQARSGSDTSQKYFKTYYNHIANYLKEQKGKLTSSVKYTEYSKMILIMTSIGKDARNIAGYNLFEPLADFETVTGQGTNGPIWALLALDSNPSYSIPKVKGVKARTTRQKLIDYLLDKETKKGGWSMTGDVPDSDLTGMALQALAPYYQVKGYERVTAAIDRALKVLSSMQNSNGGYSTMGVETSESAAQVLTGLCALGIDPMKDERFIKGGCTILENLYTYHLSGSGFMHVKAGSGNNGGGAAGSVNGMATEQSYYALTAYQRLLDHKNSLYDMSDIKLTKGAAGDGKGTGLEAQDKEKQKDKKHSTTNEKTSDKPTKDSKTANPIPDSENQNQRNQNGQQGNIQGQNQASSFQAKTLNLTAASDAKKKKAKKSSKKDGGWDFNPEDYVAEESAQEGVAMQSEVEAAKDGQESKSVSTTPGSLQGKTLLVFFVGAAAGIAATAGGIGLYQRKVKKKKR